MSSAGPAGTFSKRYLPVPSVTVSSGCAAPAGRSSTLTPGSTPPVSSETVPVTMPPACAKEADGTAASGEHDQDEDSDSAHMYRILMRADAAPTLKSS